MLGPTVHVPLDFGGPVDREFEPFPVSALDASVIDRFDDVVRRFPDRLAVQDVTNRLTYRQLSGLVDKIACAVIETTKDRTGPIAILLDSEARFPAAMLGVLAAGRGYVPLDTAHPIERNRLIASQAGAAALISTDRFSEEASNLFPQELPVINIQSLGDFERAQSRRRATPDDLAYIVYTSGSTGQPKGVYQNHRGVLHDIMQYTNALHLTPEDRNSLVYSPSVIAAVRDIYSALLNGGSVHLLPPRKLEAAGLLGALRSQGITVMHVMPTLFRHIVDALAPGQRLNNMRVVYFASERIGWSDYDDFRRACPPDAFLYITLGSTECTTVHSHWFVDEAWRRTCMHPPVGRPNPDRRVTLLDDDGHEVKKDQIGEVVVASRYIGLGYWNNAELTQKQFSIDPADPQTRILRTGDLCHWLPEQLLEFVGRKDGMVKLHGHRIEPAEIEHALIQIPEVADAVVVVRKNDAGAAQALVAYVKLRPEGQGMLPRHLAAMLEQRLPHYMIPWPIIIVDDFPRLANSKIDRAGLSQMDANRQMVDLSRDAHPVIGQVARVFERVLGVASAASDDNIASLGGDSLQAIEISTELEAQFGIAVSEQTMASARTIRDLAEWIASELSTRAPAGR